MNEINLVIVFVLISVAISYFYGKSKQRNDVQKHMGRVSENYDEYLEKAEYNDGIFKDNKNKMVELKKKMNEINMLRNKRSDEIIESFKKGNIKGNPLSVIENDEIYNNLKREEEGLFKNYEESIKNNNLKIKKIL